jgi:hypothetical protein
MRMTLAAAAAAVGFLASAAPGQAGTVVQDIPGLVQSIGDFTLFDINALPFNSALGALTDVSMELSGTYLPQTANDLGPFPATTDLTTRLFVFATNGGPAINRVLGTQTDIPVVVAGPGAAGIATGVGEPVDQTFDFSDLSAFETGVSGSQLLVEYGFRTSNGLSGGGGASDLTSFSGQAVLTYTYRTAVPEPGTIGLALMGLLGITGMGRRRR